MNASHQSPILIMAGGTGGHVFPALAVANFLRNQGEEIVWLGTKQGIEAKIIPSEQIKIEWLSVQGLRGKGVLTILMAPFKLTRACWQALLILNKIKPKAVLGMGGFASGPGGLMAWLMRIPVIIHEQNAVIGLTNKLLSYLAKINYFAFPAAAKKIRKSIVVGNPVRKEILQIEKPEKRLTKRTEKKLNVLVVGGSLGAKTLNEIVPNGLIKIEDEYRPNVRHQCGSRHLKSCESLYQCLGVDAEVMDFIVDMKEAYEWSDLVICRAGALTIAELSAAGVASILIPFPYAVDDHQMANAKFLVDVGGAEVIRDHLFTSEYVAKKIMELSNNKKVLKEMALNARSVAYFDATEQVANGILQEALT